MSKNNKKAKNPFCKTEGLIEICHNTLEKIQPYKRDGMIDDEYDKIQDALLCHILLQFNQDFDLCIKKIYETHQQSFKSLREDPKNKIAEYLKKVDASWKNTHDIHNILLMFGIKVAQEYFNHIDYQTIKPFLELRNSVAHNNVMFINKDSQRTIFYNSVQKAHITECAKRFVNKIDNDIKTIITALQSS